MQTRAQTSLRLHARPGGDRFGWLMAHRRRFEKADGDGDGDGDGAGASAAAAIASLGVPRPLLPRSELRPTTAEVAAAGADALCELSLVSGWLRQETPHRGGPATHERRLCCFGLAQRLPPVCRRPPPAPQFASFCKPNQSGVSII